MDFIAFDLETTGVDPSKDHIIEIGAVKFSDSQVVDGYGQLINPGCPIPAEAKAVNGITDDMVLDKPIIEDVLPEFATFCEDLPLVAHNASFDYKFLLRDINKFRSLSPRGCVLDTLALSRRVFPGMANYKLWTLVRHFDFPSGAFHRAEEDSSYCGLLFAKIVETLIKRKEPYSLDDLQKLIGKPPMTFPVFGMESDQLDLF